METAENELFSKNIKYLRKRENLKQEELAEKLFVTPQAISKWETSKSIPDVKMLITISKLFNVSVDELLNVDLEVSNVTKEPEAELASEISPTNVVRSPRNVLVFDKNTKNYKGFIVTSILFFIFLAAMIPTFFFHYNLLILIGLGLVFILNIAVCIYQIKILFHRDEVGLAYLSTTIENRKKLLKVCMPINLAVIIFVLSVLFLLEEFNENTLSFYHIYLIVSLLWLSITEMLNFVFYNQALEDAERI